MEIRIVVLALSLQDALGMAFGVCASSCGLFGAYTSGKSNPVAKLGGNERKNT